MVSLAWQAAPKQHYSDIHAHFLRELVGCYQREPLRATATYDLGIFIPPRHGVRGEGGVKSRQHPLAWGRLDEHQAENVRIAPSE